MESFKITKQQAEAALAHVPKGAQCVVFCKNETKRGALLEFNGGYYKSSISRTNQSYDEDYILNPPILPNIYTSSVLFCEFGDTKWKAVNSIPRFDVFCLECVLSCLQFMTENDVNEANIVAFE